ncbi:hypothetical protein ACG33_09990 [Steroidobacter denitrificans]|uniref:Uncharacterized protein n=1 Tax=Steroidobacter denitrificans TaxID=465721 RepID=A0A127FCM4_STEDE|nr:hypothetical protein [Steroidobacter denitrificans]AMN47420.1 hypothetical protein ACG33_09990 [Steroidobacter denitrificans]
MSRPPIDPELQAQIDAQLLEQGAFTPLDLLFNSGRLFYEDYERWRRREIDLLETALMGAIDKIKEQLSHAAGYARSIGLQEQTQEFTAWLAAETHPLRISADAQLQRLIAARYVPAQNAPQMDLFFDNPVVALINGIAAALCARDAVEARRRLDRLYVQAPTHADLATFDQLLAALEHLESPVASPRQEMQALLGITPGAKRLLGTQARDLLAPLWSRIGQSLATVAFAPQEPELHASFAFAQAQDWRNVEFSILGEPQWWLYAPLCLHLAYSAVHRGRRIEALAAWAQLCWLAPEHAAAEFERRQQPDRGIAALWQRFLEMEDALERQTGRSGNDSLCLEECLDARDFPAWLLMHEPGLVQQLPEDLPRSDGPGERHYRCVHRLIQARRAERADEELALRTALRHAHPALFACLKRLV